MAAEGGDGLIGGPQDQRLCPPEPAGGIEQRQGEGQQQQGYQQTEQPPGQRLGKGGAVTTDGGIHRGSSLERAGQQRCIYFDPMVRGLFLDVNLMTTG
ncbi:hypothetical protein D3C75_944750 [compost metagenome]